MGTRGLLGLIIKGEKRGIFNRYDSYDSGLGALIVLFILILDEERVERMARNLEKVVWLNEDDTPSNEIIELLKPLGLNKEPYVTKDPSLMTPEEHDEYIDYDVPYLNRCDNGINPEEKKKWWYQLRAGELKAPILLPFILSGELGYLIDSTDFGEDGLFCEYTYWVDFDNKTFSLGHKYSDESHLDGKSTWSFDDLKERTCYWHRLAQKLHCQYRQQSLANQVRRRYIDGLRRSSATGIKFIFESILFYLLYMLYKLSGSTANKTIGAAGKDSEIQQYKRFEVVLDIISMSNEKGKFTRKMLERTSEMDIFDLTDVGNDEDRWRALYRMAGVDLVDDDLDRDQSLKDLGLARSGVWYPIE